MNAISTIAEQARVGCSEGGICTHLVFSPVCKKWEGTEGGQHVRHVKKWKREGS
jgi:hypothetical protein